MQRIATLDNVLFWFDSLALLVLTKWNHHAIARAIRAMVYKPFPPKKQKWYLFLVPRKMFGRACAVGLGLCLKNAHIPPNRLTTFYSAQWKQRIDWLRNQWLKIPSITRATLFTSLIWKHVLRVFYGLYTCTQKSSVVLSTSRLSLDSRSGGLTREL